MVPKCNLMRDHKRPIVAYTLVLNSLTDDEWLELKLPPVSSITTTRNVQLPLLVDPSFDPVLPETPVHPACPVNVCDVLTPAVEEIVVIGGSVYGDRQCHPECYAGLGGTLVCLFDEVNDVSGGLECVDDVLESLEVVTDEVICPIDDIVPGVWKVFDGNLPAKLQLDVPAKPQEENAPTPPLPELPPSSYYGATPSHPPD